MIIPLLTVCFITLSNVQSHVLPENKKKMLPISNSETIAYILSTSGKCKKEHKRKNCFMSKIECIAQALVLYKHHLSRHVATGNPHLPVGEQKAAFC